MKEKVGLVLTDCSDTRNTAVVNQQVPIHYPESVRHTIQLYDQKEHFMPYKCFFLQYLPHKVDFYFQKDPV